MQRYRLFINGEWVDPASGQWFDSVNPYTGQAWAEIPRGNRDDVSALLPVPRIRMPRPGPPRSARSAHHLVSLALGTLGRPLQRTHDFGFGRGPVRPQSGCGAQANGKMQRFLGTDGKN